MLLLLHITVAILSVILGTFTFFNPSELKLKVNYFLIALTLISGTVLIFQNPSHLATTCLTGIAYVGIVSVETVVTQRKLAKVKL